VVVQFRNLDRPLLCRQAGKKDLKRKVREGLAKGAKKRTSTNSSPARGRQTDN
jgi:hypothetical protein